MLELDQVEADAVPPVRLLDVVLDEREERLVQRPEGQRLVRT